MSLIDTSTASTWQMMWSKQALCSKTTEAQDRNPRPTWPRLSRWLRKPAKSCASAWHWWPTTDLCGPVVTQSISSNPNWPRFDQANRCCRNSVSHDSWANLGEHPLDGWICTYDVLREHRATQFVVLYSIIDLLRIYCRRRMGQIIHYSIMNGWYLDLI